MLFFYKKKVPAGNTFFLVLETWILCNVSGEVPSGRSGSTLAIQGDHGYIFGGYKRDMYS